MQKIYVLDTNVLLCDPKPENWVIMQGKYSASCRISVKRAVYGKEWKWSREEKFL